MAKLGGLLGLSPVAERALALAETAYGPEHPDVGVRLNTLALILRGLGDLAAARPLAEPHPDGVNCVRRRVPVYHCCRVERRPRRIPL